jgi:16S rRNA (uracil1498-N3)-methyltransferase
MTELVRNSGSEPLTLFYGTGCAGRFLLSPEDSHHAVRVLRFKMHERAWCIDGSGTAFEVELDTLDPRAASGEIRSQRPGYHEPAAHIELLCGMAQPARMDWVVEKATELGVHEIRPVLGQEKPGPGRVRRWSRIARGAAKQCLRGCVPTIHEPAALADHLGILPEGGIRILAEWGGGEFPSLQAPLSRVVLAVGHDHGFSGPEKRQLLDSGFQPVHLGDRRLRTETAVLVLLSRLLQKLP